jgi:hypothetical protein
VVNWKVLVLDFRKRIDYTEISELISIGPAWRGKDGLVI